MVAMIERIDSPDILKGLTNQELDQLAAEIRAELIETVPKNGGHLASNLGVVELTIALHRVFESPRDKIIWDVGHQSYVHKLLTGRRERFRTIRQYGGLSGFPDRSESNHDAFNAGHASTSISVALGMALARDLAGDSYHIVAVIGDGAFGGGMAFEALNHTGQLGQRLIIVLNDNGMSISPSVGAVSKLLNMISLDSRYELAKDETKKAIGRLPFGDATWAISKRIKGRIKRALLPTALWEELGYVYLGPVDGHNIRELEAALSRARDHETRPTLIHVLTQKGKGYPPAEADSASFHGISPKGSSVQNIPTYSEIFGRTVSQLMRQDKRVVAISAAMLDGTGLAIPAKDFPNRVFDVGICEQHAVTLAAGLAAQGMIPIVAIYSTFLQRAYDQIIHDVCIPKLPVIFAVDRAGIVGDDGKTHHGAFDISYLRVAPNMVVSAPRNGLELQDLLFTAVDARCPMAIRYPRGVSEEASSAPHPVRLIPIGKGELLRDGRDVAILALGSMVSPAIEASELLAREGIECAVADARFAKPLDEELILDLAASTNRLVTIEENVLAGGIGSAVVQLLSTHQGVLNCSRDVSDSGHLSDVGISTPIPGRLSVECMGLPDRFVEHGTRDRLLRLLGLDSVSIAKRIRDRYPELTRQGDTQRVGGIDR